MTYAKRKQIYNAVKERKSETIKGLPSEPEREWRCRAVKEKAFVCMRRSDTLRHRGEEEEEGKSEKPGSGIYLLHRAHILSRFVD